jgi:FkbM family methyltransferase
MTMREAFRRCIDGLLVRLDLQLIRRSFLESKLLELASYRADIGRLEQQVSVFAEHVTRSPRHDARDDAGDFMQFFARTHDRSHSQWSQDAFVMYATGMKRGGTYLEIGGADGINGSNTLALRDHLGWTGVLVEPDPNQFAWLSRNRPTDRLVNAAISPRGGTGKAVLRQVGLLSCLEDYSPDDSHVSERDSAGKTVTVETIDLTDLLRSMGDIDYFSLDVEGAEYEILSSLRWDEVKPPALLTVEHNHREDAKALLRTLLGGHGYQERFVGCDWLTRGDLWFTHASARPSEVGSGS